MPYTSLCLECLERLESTVHVLATRVPAPGWIVLNGNRYLRFKEQSIYQAIVLKLARLVSNLRAAQLLLDNGFVQELGALQRMIDEGNEDVTFLTLAVMTDEITDLHNRFLSAFWQEEFDEPTALQSTQKRPSIPRKSITAWNARHPFSGTDESTGVAVATTIYKTYSGYIHGASTHIMDLYGGNPPHFHMKGMLKTPRHEEHKDDLLNYYHRTIASHAFAAKAFGDTEMFNELYGLSYHFTMQTGVS